MNLCNILYITNEHNTIMKCHYDIFQVIFSINLKELVKGLLAWGGLLGDLQIYLNPHEVYGLKW